MTKYRYTIGLNKYPYGTELEFADALLQQLDWAFQKTDIPLELALLHKHIYKTYDRTYLDLENDVSEIKGKLIYGGEISSRLYHDKKEDWSEIEIICDVLKENGASINECCSNQVSIDLSPVKKENIFIESLAKLIAVYENEMNFFYMGDGYLERAKKEKYAKSMRSELIRRVNKIKFSENHNYMYDLLERRSPLFTNRCGINLGDYRENGRMEIRYPNGTLNKKTIQNNINFSLKLVNAIEEEKFDVENLTREINEDLEMKHYGFDNLSEKEHYKRFERLATTISTSSEDQNDFMSQYEKVLSTKPKR